MIVPEAPVVLLTPAISLAPALGALALTISSTYQNIGSNLCQHSGVSSLNRNKKSKNNFSPINFQRQIILNFCGSEIISRIKIIFDQIVTDHNIVEPPGVPPEITGVPLKMSQGDWLKLQCHLPWMNVKPSLEFWVNGRRAKHMVS